MRLLNTTSLTFEDFFDSQIPDYAILSHRWGPKEVLFKEMRKRTAEAGPGLIKIEKCCQLAASRGYEWVWIDTCCIDKKSSAELSEAINSMYKWYKRSKLCYVYLSDVTMTPEEIRLKNTFNKIQWTTDSAGLMARFRSSYWFTRGWTLQELLAPFNVIFFDAGWNEIGTKRGLALDISTATNIQTEYVLGKTSIFDASIAKRMSFASRRVTSRGEDMSYCLLGLFGVNMPLLYGEGAGNAFLRLQTEIMKVSSDESLFAWRSERPASGMLAREVSCFEHSGTITLYKDLVYGLSAEGPCRPPCTMSSRGVQLAIPHHSPEKGLVPVYLDCYDEMHHQEGRGKKPAVCIQLHLREGAAFRTRPRFLHSNDYPQRYDPCSLVALQKSFKRTRVVYVRNPTASEQFAEVLHSGTTSPTGTAHMNRYLPPASDNE